MFARKEKKMKKKKTQIFITLISISKTKSTPWQS